MSFTLLPALDVADGQAVRLGRGDPLDLALSWQADGAPWIHLVDLDAAYGHGSNADLLDAVIARLDVPVELAGGIRDDVSLARALASGCARVVLGTAALADLAWCARAIAAHGERIAVGLDVRIVEQADGSVQHRLVARGSAEDVGDLGATLARLDREGCARYIVTDVSRDGMLGGPNVELYRAVTRMTRSPVIASGGISGIADLVALAEIAGSGANLDGSIVGKALHAGRFTLPDALVAIRDVGP